MARDHRNRTQPTFGIFTLPQLRFRRHTSRGPMATIRKPSSWLRFRQRGRRWVPARNQVIACDLTSVFLVSRAAVRLMLPQQSGRIVNIASIAGKEGNPTLVPYSTAKAGVIGFTKALAKEVASRGIFVNAVAPAVIGTDMVKQMSKETVDYLIAKIPMGRVGRPEEVAALVAWLASDECSFSTGAVYDLSGGRATY